mgnify:CR=1 FL=1
MRIKLERCGICLTWRLLRVHKHCYVCGAYHLIVGNKHVYMNVNGVDMARAIPLPIDSAITRTIERLQS